MLFIEPTAGESINDFIKKMITLTSSGFGSVHGTHNGVNLVANKKTTYDELLDQWDEGRRIIGEKNREEKAMFELPEEITVKIGKDIITLYAHNYNPVQYLRICNEIGVMKRN